MDCATQPTQAGVEIDEQSRSRRSWRIRMLILHGAMLVGPLLAPRIGLHVRGGVLSTCIFKYATGLDCPGCGVTRSAVAMLSGRFGDAFRIHLGAPLIVVLLLMMTSYFAAALVAHRGMEWRKEVAAYRYLEGLAACLLVAGWLGRILIN